MKSQRLGLYRIDIKYVRNLANVDDRVMSVSPQEGKASRPFVGVILICDEYKYCIPMSSPKPKHATMKNDKDFSKIIDKHGKLIGVLNFNSMIPVNDDVITLIDIKIKPDDSPKDKAYKGLLNDQLDWCNDNRDTIINKANKLYRIVTKNPEKMIALARRCCDFKKLEKICNRYASL